MDAEAWRRFRGRLADHVAAMEDGDVLLLEYRRSAAAADSPCVQFFAWGRDLVRCEVPANQFLHPVYRLDEERREQLTALGWEPPNPGPNGSSSYHLDRTRNRSDELAAMTVRVLRELWGVPHPTLLDSVTGGRGTTPAFALRDPGPVPEFDFGQAVQPSSRRHLQMLVERTMRQALGHEPHLVEDGMIELDAAFGPLWIAAARHEPVVEISTLLDRKIEDEERAAAEVLALGLRLPADWLVDESGIVVTARVDGSPFVPRHLVNALHDFYAAMHELDAHLPPTLGDSSPGSVNPPGPRASGGTVQLGLFDNPGESTRPDESGD
ncbi:hypothetical protein OG921_19395 [Aldersonia sp. NBC_00410]|uniref:TY-Chap domain-containing protein n=1 Tax=Aldersonia sp. NBC_00410 TaxID=2975954 RepID=UPI00224F87D5|nr:hypothetical protein [Aldersonia sp. NBC_00410]MCX5045335.1 hypothetical protein [Aldersonia sp. NBC_00410]